MKETTFNKKQLIKYLIWTFGIAYLMQAAIGVLAWNGLALAAQPMMAVMMFVPLLGVLLSGFKLRNIGWKPRFKGNVRYILFAWFAPLVLTAVGAGLYFLSFPRILISAERRSRRWARRKPPRSWRRSWRRRESPIRCIV